MAFSLFFHRFNLLPQNIHPCKSGFTGSRKWRLSTGFLISSLPGNVGHRSEYPATLCTEHWGSHCVAQECSWKQHYICINKQNSTTKTNAAPAWPMVYIYYSTSQISARYGLQWPQKALISPISFFCLNTLPWKKQSSGSLCIICIPVDIRQCIVFIS